MVAKASRMARPGSSGVERSLKTSSFPAARYTQSVNVPPVSMPITSFAIPSQNISGEEQEDCGLWSSTLAAGHPSDEDLSPGTPGHPSDEDLSPGTPGKAQRWARSVGFPSAIVLDTLCWRVRDSASDDDPHSALCAAISMEWRYSRSAARGDRGKPGLDARRVRRDAVLDRADAPDDGIWHEPHRGGIVECAHACGVGGGRTGF